MDIPTIAAVLTSIKSATEIAKLLKETDLSLEKAEVKLKLADLISTLADAKMEIAGVQDLLREKETKIRELEEVLALRADLEYEAPYYWRINEGKKDGPFCQQCYDADDKLIRLQEKRTKGAWDCKRCGKHFYDEQHKKTNATNETFRVR
jgi:ribosomal protein L37AE/L43A